MLFVEMTIDFIAAIHIILWYYKYGTYDNLV